MSAYAAEVRERRYPTEEHSYGIDPEELERFREIVAPGKAWDICRRDEAEGSVTSARQFSE